MSPAAVQRTAAAQAKPLASRHALSAGQNRLSAPSSRMVSATTFRPRTFRPQMSAQNKIIAAAAPVAETADEDTPGVYLYQPKQLEEGVNKHTLSVFVADEPGLINRVAGVFARRGANIESLAVALNLDKALFTIVLTGTENAVVNLCKQVGKLVKVRQVADITKANKLDRELMLIKVSAGPGAARTEVLQIAEVYRAHIEDLGSDTIILSCIGDPGKLAAFQKILSSYGILEVARTGRIALLRSQERLMGGGWGDSRLYQKRSTAEPLDSADSLGVDVSLPLDEDMNNDGDVYAIGDSMGDFMGVEPLVDLTIDESMIEQQPDETGVSAHMLSIVVNDCPGVLNLVTGVFARRGYNVISLAVGPSVQKGISRISMVAPGTNASIAKLIKQLYKIVNVVEVTDLTGTPHVARELCLIKVSCTPRQRRDLETVANIFHGSVVDVGPTSLVIQVQGRERKMKALQDVLQPYGILEVARTGRVALTRSSGVDSTFLQRYQEGRIM